MNSRVHSAGLVLAAVRRVMRGSAAAIAPSPFAGQTREVRCACGATREAPVGLAIVSCVQCGAAMGQAAHVVRNPPPSRTLLALATFPTQLLGAIAFALALVWMVSFGARDAVVVSVLVGGAACVFASGAAYRGSVAALVLCAIVDVAIAIAFAAVPLARVGEMQFDIGRIIVAGVAAIAAAECVVAVPQARQFAAWCDDLVKRT